jgi:hypothetical protein
MYHYIDTNGQLHANKTIYLLGPNRQSEHCRDNEENIVPAIKWILISACSQAER